MNITLITQSDPFYLAKNIDYLIKNLPSHSQIVSTVIFDVSPFGKRETFSEKIIKTYRLFGLAFFIHYSYKFLLNKVNNRNNVSKILRKNNIPVITLDKTINNPESLTKISYYKPDLLISIAGNQIFKKKLIELAPKGCLNLHTALLPKYRGLMPSFWVLKNNEKETGVSVFFVDEGIDSGPILVQKQIPIHNKMTQTELIKKSKRIGMDALIEAIELIQSGNYKLIFNDDSQKSYYSFPTKQDVKEFLKSGKKFY